MLDNGFIWIGAVKISMMGPVLIGYFGGVLDDCNDFQEEVENNLAAIDPV